MTGDSQKYVVHPAFDNFVIAKDLGMGDYKLCGSGGVVYRYSDIFAVPLVGNFKHACRLVGAAVKGDKVAGVAVF